MSNYRPSEPFTVPVYLLIPSYKTVKGVLTKVYPKPEEGELIYCSFKTYGGTETANNGLISVEDTANIETWYRPNIKADCRICLAQDVSAVYEVMGQPENINMRNQYTKFKVRAIGGGA